MVMKLKRSKITKIFGLLAVIFLTGTFYVYPEKKGYFFPVKEGVEKNRDRGKVIAEKLGLSEEQKETIRSQRQESQGKIRELRRRLHMKRRALKKELDKKESNRKKVKSLVENIKKVYGAILTERTKGIISLKKVLTPEQYVKFRKIVRRAH